MKVQELLTIDFEAGKDSLCELAVAVGRTDRLAASGVAEIGDDLRALADAARARLKENHKAAVAEFEKVMSLTNVLGATESALRDMGPDEDVDPVELFESLIGIDEWCCAARALGLDDQLPDRIFWILGAFVSDLCCVQAWAETFMRFSGVNNPDLPEYRVWNHASTSKEAADALDALLDKCAFEEEEIPLWLEEVMDKALAAAQAELATRSVEDADLSVEENKD
jgi:hypothetical protein